MFFISSVTVMSKDVSLFLRSSAICYVAEKEHWLHGRASTFVFRLSLIIGTGNMSSFDSPFYTALAELLGLEMGMRISDVKQEPMHGSKRIVRTYQFRICIPHKPANLPAFF